MATAPMQSWPPPEPPKPPLAVSHTARALLSGTEQAVAFVRFVALEAECAEGDDDDLFKCIYCGALADVCAENIGHKEECLYAQACAIEERLRIEGVPW